MDIVMDFARIVIHAETIAEDGPWKLQLCLIEETSNGSTQMQVELVLKQNDVYQSSIIVQYI